MVKWVVADRYSIIDLIAMVVWVSFLDEGHPVIGALIFVVIMLVGFGLSLWSKHRAGKG